jgi:L-ribulose-5-phosphate 4-epimerase
MAITDKELSRVDFTQLIARAVRILNARGVMHKSGHVAARDDRDPNVMWINTRQASRSTLTARDVVRVDIRTDKQIGDGDKPPSELYIHTAIFRRRPEIGAIVHSHPEHIVALSVAGKPLVPVTVDGGFLGGPVPVLDDAGHISNPARGELVAEAMGDRSAVVLRGHGVVVAGTNVEQAVTRIILAEENARMEYLALAIGDLRPLGAEELAAIARHTGSAESIRKAWHYEEETARRSGALDGVEG